MNMHNSAFEMRHQLPQRPHPPLPTRRWLNVTEAAEYLGVSQSTFSYHAKRHRLIPVRFTKQSPRYDVQDLDRLMEDLRDASIAKAPDEGELVQQLRSPHAVHQAFKDALKAAEAIYETLKTMDVAHLPRADQAARDRFLGFEREAIARLAELVAQDDPRRDVDESSSEGGAE